MMFGRFPAGGWNPLVAGTPLAWFDASTGVVHSGATFTSWTDRVNGQALTVAGGSASYSATGWNSSKPGVTLAVSALDFSGIAQPLTSHHGKTTWVATVNTTGSGIRFLAGWYDGATGSTYGIGVDATTNALDRLDPTTVSSPSGGSISAQGLKRWCVRDASTTSAGGLLTTYVDGRLDTSGGTVSARTVQDTFRMGCNSVGLLLFTGTVAELIVYAGDLDIAAQYTAYSRATWGG
jgi:hypothetical protein